MKSLTAIALLCVLGTGAAAKPEPVGRERSSLAVSAVNIDIISSAVRERAYFQAPHAEFNSGSLVCRLPMIVFDKTRLASSCP